VPTPVVEVPCFEEERRLAALAGWELSMVSRELRSAHRSG
jgi:hypothetical protein